MGQRVRGDCPPPVTLPSVPPPVPAGRTVLEALGDFKSAQLPLEWLLQVRGGVPLVPPPSLLLPLLGSPSSLAPAHLHRMHPAPHPLQVCPRLKPRQFSVASSLAAHPRCAQLAVAIVDWATPFKRRRRGVCTSWLAGLQPEQVGGPAAGEGRGGE